MKKSKKLRKKNRRNNKILWIATILEVMIGIAIVVLLIHAIRSGLQGENKDTQTEQELEEITDGSTHDISSEQQSERELEELQEEIADLPAVTVEEGEAPEDPKSAEVNLDEIPGYTAKVDEKMAEDIAGMELPYQVPDSSIQILSVGQYTGPFIETGQDIPTDNVLTLVVENTGEKMIEYAEIHLNAGEEEAVFKITALPAETAMMVQELNQLKYSKDITYSYLSAVEALVQDEKGMHEDQVSVIGENGKITVTNNSDENIPELYVCYHTVQSGGVYRGGITYRVAFENIAAGESKTVESGHFYEKSSSILFVDIPSQSTQ